MKFNTTWQLSLCTVALLITLIACDQKISESKALQPAFSAKDVALEKKKDPVSANARLKEKEAAPGDYRDDLASYAADSTATSLTSERAEEEQAPPAPRQQHPRQQPAPAIQQVPAPRVDWDKKIIKTANLQVEVADYKKYHALLRTAVQAAGGYIANEEQSESDYKIENTLTLKVPVDQFDAAVAALTPGAEKIRVKKITAEDVTGEVVDTRSRLEAKKQVRLRYLDLLRQAKNMEEILQVQNEINSLQENIEAAAGRVQYLTHAAAFSTIQLSFYQVLNPSAVNNDVPPGFGQRILLGLGAGLAWIGELLIVLITLWPLWAVVAILWWLVRRYKPFRKQSKGTPVFVHQPISTSGAVQPTVSDTDSNS
ncbi:DUF4349 domain-containing protein [Paraflavitalea pollutisoli]|uniref:DUF4349 domain-containing protein n=1 Tax=Paraflavitalea pollutisoli TaxID=3034143 RepID=UPI0023EC4C14|nr:DUF4349 domain-containing protein [Paraflavitalea sp. H1-2-19X]